MKSVVICGYDRRAKVPSIEGSKPKVCVSCQCWFAAFGKERRCDNCVPATERHRRMRNRNFGYRAPFKKREKLTLVGGSDHGALCLEMARERAGEVDYPKGPPTPMPRAVALYYTRRNVELGKQGYCDLERYRRRERLAA